MMDNKSKTSLIRHVQEKYINHEDLQYDTHALDSYHIIFKHGIFFLYMSFGKFSYCIFVLMINFENYFLRVILN